MPEEITEMPRCRCGEKLVDGLDDAGVQVGQAWFRFRRDTDYVVCPSCTTTYRINDLRPGDGDP